MGIFSLLSGIFAPATALLDEVITSEEEKLQAKAVLLELQTQVVNNFVEYEKKLLESKTAIITAEAGADSWLTRTWRPITMLTFVGIIVLSFFSDIPVPDDLWFVIKLGLGGYVGGRSLEKITPGIMKALKKPDEV